MTASAAPEAPAAAPKRPNATYVLLGLTTVALLLFLGSIGAVAWIVSGSKGEVSEGSFLELRLGGAIPDAPLLGGFYLDPEDAPTILTDITAAIRAAGEDKRIEGLLIHLDAPELGWAGVQDIRDALASFRAAGKPCVAYAEVFTTGAYYLASSCDQVVMAPSGIATITGIAATTTYYAETFEKIGVEANLLHVGDFKSAVEPYERTGPSEPAALAMNELLDGIWGQFIAHVAEGRGVTPEVAQQWIDEPSLTPAGLLASGVIDAVAFPDQLRARVSAVGEEGWVASLVEPVTDTDSEIDERFTPFREFLKSTRANQPKTKEKVAVVYVEGPIVSGEAEGGLFGGQVIADRTVRNWLEAVRKDESVKAVVLRVNSPGGSGLASDMIWHELERIKADGKPLVVSMGNVAASGGYYIAAPADWIVAHPATITGSIGVFGGKLAIREGLGKLGLHQHTYKRGEQADLLSMSEPFTESGRAVFQSFIDQFYETFLGRVSTGRELERDAVHMVAQGRVWTGTQALEHKLVDELGGLDEAVAKAAELAELETYGVARWPKQKSFVDLLMEDFEGGASLDVTSLLGLDHQVLLDLVVLDRVLEGGVAAFLPLRFGG